jgi:MarR family transcriptional regulator for hemolysin
MEEPIGRELAVTGRMVRDRFDACLGHHGASLATWVVLRGAEREEGLSQRELAHRLNIEGPTLVRHLDRMEQDGLVERCRDGEDRRVMRVRLTPAGRRRHAELAKVAAGVDEQLRALLTDHEVETLERVLPRIREHWHPTPETGGRR